MRITKVLTVNIDRVPITEAGKRVYRALLKTGAKTADELCKHMDLDDGIVYLMLAQLYNVDLIKLEV